MAVKEKDKVDVVEIGGKRYVVFEFELYDRLLDRLDSAAAKKALEDENDPVISWDEAVGGLISNKIAEARKKAGLTQKELAKRMKITQSALSRLEKQDANVTLSTLRRAAKALGCPAQELI